MKTTITAAAIVLATLSGAASAMTTPSNADLATIQFYVPNAKVESLTNQEVTALLNVINSADSNSEILSAIRSAVN